MRFCCQHDLAFRTLTSFPLTKSQKFAEWKHWGSVQVQVPRFANSKTPACKLSVRVRVYENRKRKMDKERRERSEIRWNSESHSKVFSCFIMFSIFIIIYHVFVVIKCSKLAKVIRDRTPDTPRSTKVLSASLPGLPAPGNFTRSRQWTQGEL